MIYQKHKHTYIYICIYSTKKNVHTKPRGCHFMEIYITMDKLCNEEGVFTLKIYIVQFL